MRNGDCVIAFVGNTKQELKEEVAKNLKKIGESEISANSVM